MNKKTRNGRGSNNNKRPTSKGTRKQDSYSPKFDKTTATNDPMWYSTDPSMLRDAASIPFSWSVGSPINLHNPITAQLPSGDEFSIPGLCSLMISPSVGWADSASDPVNTAAFRIYSFVRHANSGHSNYDAPDMMLYLMAMSQVYSYINFLQRAYGVATLYSQKNRYMPNALLTSMHIDAEDIVNHLADFRYGINVLINKAASLYVPATQTIFARHASLFKNIYVEGPSLKEQLYLYNPYGFWKYTLNTDNSGMLKMMPMVTGNHRTVQELLEYGRDMLDRLIQSEDMNIMSGDILKAYGEGSLIKLAPLDTNFPVVPIYDSAVLEQMKNATVFDAVTGMDVYQDASHGFLKHMPTASLKFTDATYSNKAKVYTLETAVEDRILTTASTDPTPELVMENTRLMVGATNYKRSEDGLSATAELRPGSEYCVSCTFYRYDRNAAGTWLLLTHAVPYVLPIDAGDATAMAVEFRNVGVRGHFKFHPAVHAIIYKEGSTAGSFNMADAMMQYDVDNYAILTSLELEKLHETALLSEFNVPSLVKI